MFVLFGSVPVDVAVCSHHITTAYIIPITIFGPMIHQNHTKNQKDLKFLVKFVIFKKFIHRVIFQAWTQTLWIKVLHCEDLLFLNLNDYLGGGKIIEAISKPLNICNPFEFHISIKCWHILTCKAMIVLN